MDMNKGSGYGTAVENMPGDKEVVDSNPARVLVFFS